MEFGFTEEQEKLRKEIREFFMEELPQDYEPGFNNMMGEEVTRTDIAGTETQIKVSDVNTNYVVKVVSDNSAVTGKVYVK